MPASAQTLRPETILSVLPGATDHARTVIAMNPTGPGNLVEMRQETFSPAVGWFVQSRIELSAEQVAGVRRTLGTIPSARPTANKTRRTGSTHFRDTAADSPMTLAFPGGERAATA